MKKKVGKYILHLDDILGKGNFGKVVRAVQANTENQFAVKIIDKKRNQYTKSALVREVEIMKNLKSPHIIQCYQVHETNNNVYIISQLAKDGNLRQYMSKNKIKEEQALDYIMQIMTGLAQLVRNGIIHRDIKPSNILMVGGKIKITDFGLAKTKNLSCMQSIVGTPSYMAPQVLNRQIFKSYTYKCDIWSFGVLCYQLIVGQFPWKIKTNNIKQLFLQIKQQSLNGIQFPQHIKIRQEVKDMIRGCLIYEQKNRYDWKKLFKHQAFNKKKFIDNNISIQQAYTVTHLRMCIHSQNINLKKLFQGMPSRLKKDDLLLILKGIDPQISTQQIMSLFNSWSKSDQVQQDKIIQYFKNHHVKVGKKNKYNNQKNIKLQKLIEGLALEMQRKDIDTYDLFKKFDTKKKNSLKQQEFNKLLLSLNSNLNNQELQELFIAFDTNKDKLIKFNQFYQKICKIGQVIKIQDDNLHESLKKLKNKKST